MTMRRRWRHGLNIFDQALHALGDNRLRTWLSVMGIAIGIAAVIAVSSVSQGGHFLVFRELETFGLKSVWIRRLDDDKGPQRSARAGSGIDVADLEAIRAANYPAVARITPIVNTGPAPVLIHSASRYSNAKVAGIDVAYLAINNDDLSAGVGIRPEDVRQHRRSAIIGSTVAQDLFGTQRDIIGREFRIDEYKYVVSGVLGVKSRDFLASIGSAGQDANNRILVPYTTLHLQLGHHHIHTLQAEAIDFEHAASAAGQIADLLTERHRRAMRYRSETMASYIATADRILKGVSLIGVIAAGISLLVGGMGIMNIVATSVLERTREIGLRKAIGASSATILLQFLFESMIVSTVGGALGLLGGIAASFLLTRLTGLPLTPSLSTIGLALAVSILVGLLSGYYPARRAARLRPVLALRYE